MNEKPCSRLRKTKIVCTIGPATFTPDRIKGLVQSGMDVARLNFSHGDRQSHRRTIQAIRSAARDLGKEIGILQDLGGPKIRLGKLAREEINLEAGQKIYLSPGERQDDPELIPVTYPALLDDVGIGNHILLADGTVELIAVEKTSSRIGCTVIVGGTIQSHKGVNLPTSNLQIPALTEKDRKDLEVGLEEEVDFIALSFIRNEEDLAPVLKILGEASNRPMFIAKIEKPQAVERFERILAMVDAVMVARGDLGVEMPLEEVPIIQKRIIQQARKAGKPVITATQMLTSMLQNPRPTRAEATDVANAILDGTDALMLSDETAVGSYPIEAVSMLDRIARNTEPYLNERPFLEEAMSELLPTTAAAISRAASWLAMDLNAAAIVASTSSGSTARLVARFRPRCPVVALTENLHTQRQLNLSWGVVPDLVGSCPDTDKMFKTAYNWVLQKGIANYGDRLIITAGVPIGISGSTNLLKVMELTQS